jgi:hypothetical protein
MRFVKRREEVGENGVVRAFVEWAKKVSAEHKK